MTHAKSHIDERTLARFLASDDISGTAREHLERCAQCQDEIERARAVEARVRALSSPMPDETLRIRIRRTLANREMADLWRPPSRSLLLRRRSSWLVGTAAAIVIAAATFLFWPAGLATAGASAGDLRFAPVAPSRAAVVDVTYQPSELLAHNERLTLRVRWRTPSDLPSQHFTRQTTAAVLERDSRGVFRARVRIPDSVVYGAFAVESPGGGRVDANGRRRWELLVHDANGQPAYLALEQKVSDLMGENWELALATARQATTIYPQLVRAWFIRDFLETGTLPRNRIDSAVAIHRARLADFDRALGNRSSLDPDQIGAMEEYAAALSDSVRQARWYARALRDAPNSIWTLNAVAGELARRARSDATGALASLDSIWRITGDLHPGVLTFGFSAAQTSGNNTAIRTWADRLAKSPRGLPAIYVYQSFLGIPALRAEGEQHLRAEIARLGAPNDSLRALDQDTLDARRARELWRREALIALSGALLLDNAMGAARDTLAVAATMTWDAKLFRKVAALDLSLGDTNSALRAFGRAAADPLFAQSFDDSARVLLGSRFDRAAWDRDLAAAKSEMRAQMLGESRSIPLRRAIRVTREDHSEVQLRNVTGNRPALVVFWSRGCQPSLQQLPASVRAAKALTALGFSVVFVTEEAPNPDVRSFLKERGFDFVSYHDQRREMRRAFSQWATPELYVLDGRGRIRFANTSLGSVGAQLASVDTR